MLACIPADYMWGSDWEYLGVSHYYVQVRYSAGAHEVLAEFRWFSPWGEGDTLSLRYDPANPECNDRTGIWFACTVLVWALIGMASWMGHNWWNQG